MRSRGVAHIRQADAARGQLRRVHRDADLAFGAAADLDVGHALHVERPFRLETENTSLSEWLRPGDHARQPGRWVLVRYNDAAHLA